MRIFYTSLMLILSLYSLPSLAQQVMSSEPEHTKKDAIELLGSEQSVQGFYTARCIDRTTSNICWLRITEQAEHDLRTKLLQNYNSLGSITLIYRDFEGYQRDSFEDGRLLVEADGTFYFDIESVNAVTSVNVTRHSASSSSTRSQAAKSTSSDKKQERDNLELSLFYVWDSNSSANRDALAISSQRYGVGLWAQNRIGFSAFKGTDVPGIAKPNGEVVNAKVSYETTGIGLGVRVWANRSITLENHIYYVDAQPFITQLENVCEQCSDRNFESQNYLQTSVNLKTNSKGLNIGWMLTWKWLDQTPNYDRLSSGFYLEALF